MKQCSDDSTSGICSINLTLAPGVQKPFEPFRIEEEKEKNMHLLRTHRIPSKGDVGGERWSDASIKWLPSINQTTRVINIVSCDIIEFYHASMKSRAVIFAIWAAARSVETAMKQTQRAKDSKYICIGWTDERTEMAYTMHSFRLAWPFACMSECVCVCDSHVSRQVCVLRRKHSRYQWLIPFQYVNCQQEMLKQLII